ncbi:MAG: hypothetical protein EU548_06720 [Promethearchaeota archaeon]|nr:MAG: hypothetical protein EU548_06720 [Candidatus Lokiarchaeota archaeon]
MAKIKKIPIYILLFVFTLLIIFPVINTNNNYDTEKIEPFVKKIESSPKNSKSWNNFTFIHIQNGNWSKGLSGGWIQGDGTYSNPYRIENMTIDASSSPLGSGIFINDTTNDYFIIQNCTIYNASSKDYDDEAGISLINTNNGTLFNNTCSNNNKGIFLEECEDITIFNNTAVNNFDEGLAVKECQSISILRNNLSNNGQAGLDLDLSTEVTVKYNNINNNGADGIEWETELMDYEEEDFYNSTIYENKIIGNGEDGIRLSMGDIAYAHLKLNFKWNNISGNIINENGNNGISLKALTEFKGEVYYSNNTFSNNILNNNGDNGIYIDAFADNTGEIYFNHNNITDNIIVDSGSNGIYFKEFAVEEAITLFNDNKINGNNFSANRDNGIYVDLDTDNDEDFPLSEANFNYNNISNNIINKSGINGINLNASVVDYGSTNCNDNTIIGNILEESRYHGIYLFECTNITVSGNNMTKCGLGISFPKESSRTIEVITSNNIDITNLVNGNPIYYYTNELNLGHSNFSNPGQVILINCNDSVISNLNISQGSIGITLNRCINNTISNINASDNIFYGISLEICYNNTVSENNASYNELAGIYLYYSYGNNNILRNKVSYNKNYGIALYYSNNTRISKNNASYNEISGLYLFNSYYNNISGNDVNINNIYGIYLEICNYTLITGNTINKNLEIGVYLLNSHNNTISDNTDTINNNVNQGVFLENSDFNIISGNTIRSNAIGIHLLDSSYNRIINNDLRNNDVYILKVGSSKGNIFEGNVFDALPPSGGDDGGERKLFEGLSEEIIQNVIIIASAIILAVSVVGAIAFKRYRGKLKEKEAEIKVLKIEKRKLTQEDIIVAKENLQCVVHKGAIKGFTFVCPECGTFYCSRCYDAVKSIENACWSCGKPLDPTKPVRTIDDETKIKIKEKGKAGMTDSVDYSPKKAPKDFKAKKK